MGKHVVRFWRGTRKSYEIIKNARLIDAWTRYSVENPDGSWTEYFGENLIGEPTGQILPVKDIVPSLDGVSLSPGDRYLVGSDGVDGGNATYQIYTVCANSEGNITIKIMDFTESYTVRVLSRGNKAYVLNEGYLISYDDVDCGEF